MPKALEIKQQISWVYTDDLDGTCNYYGNTLGLELARDEGSARIFRTGEKASIGVCLAFEGRVVQPAGGIITLVTDDVDEWYAMLRGKGRRSPRPAASPGRIRDIRLLFPATPTAMSSSFSALLNRGRS